MGEPPSSAEETESLPMTSFASVVGEELPLPAEAAELRSEKMDMKKNGKKKTKKTKQKTNKQNRKKKRKQLWSLRISPAVTCGLFGGRGGGAIPPLPTRFFYTTKKGQFSRNRQKTAQN